MSSISRMNIRKSTKVLALDVDKPLKLIIGNREATLFTKSFDYTQLLVNNYKDYIEAEEQKRILRNGFTNSLDADPNTPNRRTRPQYYNIGSGGRSRYYTASEIGGVGNSSYAGSEAGGDIFYDAVEPIKEAEK